MLIFLIQKSKIKKKCNIFKIKFLEFLNFQNFDQKFYSLQKKWNIIMHSKVFK